MIVFLSAPEGADSTSHSVADPTLENLRTAACEPLAACSLGDVQSAPPGALKKTIIDDIEQMELPIIMCGCVPSRYGAELNEQLPEVAAFVPADQEDGIVSVVADVLNIPEPTQ